jgi:hypothetical protein
MDEPVVNNRIKEAPNVGIQDVVHFFSEIQRLARPAHHAGCVSDGTHRKSEKVCLIDSVQHHRQRPLDDLVFQGGDSQWPLATICLRYEPTAGGKCSVSPAVNPRRSRKRASRSIS